MATAGNNDLKLIGPNGTEFYSPAAATLSCRLSPKISAVDMEIRWFKGTDCVCLYKNRQVTKGRGYENSVCLFTQELERGNVSLQLRDYRDSEISDFLCQVTNGDRKVELTVGVGGIEMDIVVRVSVSQWDRAWTIDERMKMEESVLLTELKEERFPGPVLKNLMTLMAESKLLEKKLKEAETELENTFRSTESTEEDLKNEGQQALRMNVSEIGSELRAVQKRIVKERQKKREREEEVMKKKMQTVVDALRSSEELIENLKKQLNQQREHKDEYRQKTSKMNDDGERRELERDLETKDDQIKEIEQELKRMQEKRRQIVKQHREEIAVRQNCAVKEDTQLFSYLHVFAIYTLICEKQRDFERRMNDKESELETLKQTMSEIGSNKKQVETLRQEQQKKSSQIQEKDLKEKERLFTERYTQLMEKEAKIEKTMSRRKSMELTPPKLSEGQCGTELRLVLLGRTGSGKSAVGSVILGREEMSQTDTSTERQQSENRQGEVAGRQVTVVDTPDWFCTGLSLEELRQDVGLCVRLSAPGPHAFLLVLPVKQSTGEEIGMLEKMEEIFGERCWRNTIILFTVTDEVQENAEEFIRSGTQEFQKLVQKCGNRFHCLNIKESGDGSQVSELLEKIKQMLTGNSGAFYSSEIYLETESQIRLMEKIIMQEREENKLREEREMKEKLEKKVQNSLRKIEGVIQEHEGDIRQLSNRTTELEKKIKEEKDKEKRRALEGDLAREVGKRKEVEEKVKRLKEKRGEERNEMEERHRQEMEEMMEKYEGEARIEAERNLMKIILPELQRNIFISKSKMQEEFSRQMEEKNRETERLKQSFVELNEIYTLLKEAYQTTILSLAGPKQDYTLN